MSVPGTFAEAVEWAKARGVVLPADFYGQVEDEAKGRAFTVSGLTALTQIQGTMDSLTKALDSGETFASWQARSGGALAGLPDGRLETIFRNFTQQAYNAGRWKQFEGNKANRPYLMFSAIDDARTTAICRQRNGLIKPIDDPFWSRNSPQLHHRCRSMLISLSEAQAQARSKSGSGLNKPPPTDEATGGWGYKPSGDDMAAGLVVAIADAAKNAPVGWLSSLLGFFAGGWGAITTWIRRIFGG